MKRLLIGTILLIIGLSIFSPFEEILLIVPLSLLFGAWIIPFSFMVAIACLGLAVYVLGESKYVPIQVKKHILVITSVGIALAGLATYYLYFI